MGRGAQGKNAFTNKQNKQTTTKADLPLLEAEPFWGWGPLGYEPTGRE